MSFRFRVLGTIEVEADAVAVPIDEPAQRGLLAALALNANRMVSRERLAAAVWARRPEQLRVTVDGCVARLRLASPKLADRLRRRPGGYSLSVAPDELDVERFILLLRQGIAALAADDRRAAVHLLGSALAAWRGPAAADTPAHGWLRDQLTELERLRARAVEARELAAAAGVRAAG
jgi:DNA-binding SARP family transcriptional activator